ncbi:hypothetical protein LXL04_007294 [Taraxacum kok-saghyz]
MSWDELKTMMLEEYCPRSEVQNLKQEFCNLTIKGSEVKAYTTRLTELQILYSGSVTPVDKKSITVRLTDQGIRHGSIVQKADPPLGKSNKRKSWEISTTMTKDDAFRGARQAQFSKRGPFEILDRIGPITYRLSLPSELSNMRSFCHSLRQEISGHKVGYEHRISPTDEWSEQMHYRYMPLGIYGLRSYDLLLLQAFV